MKLIILNYEIRIMTKKQKKNDEIMTWEKVGIMLFKSQNYDKNSKLNDNKMSEFWDKITIMTKIHKRWQKNV